MSVGIEPEVPLKHPTRQIVAADSALGKGLDIALTLAIFFGIGFALDRWLGTTPLFMIMLSVMSAVGLMARTWSRYETAMQQQEAERKDLAKAARR
jgi:F0F1-type ATP synthase assembly protein I